MAATAPRDASHASGTLERAEALRVTNPAVATQSIFAAAVLGDADGIRHFLDRDAATAVAAGGPHGWDALTYLCFSRYLRLDRARSEGFVHAAVLLLDAGANPNTGWVDQSHQPRPEWESAIYGAAGIAHHAGLTKLLLERGADPNDEETPYHAGETHDNRALRVLVESGKLNRDSLATILLRKADWHDHAAILWLLELGVDPNHRGRWEFSALQQAVRRDNALETIDLLLDRGADATQATGGISAIAIAARRGRADVLRSFARRGVSLGLTGTDALLAACALHDPAAIRAIAEHDPASIEAVRAHGGQPLAEFAGTWNAAGVKSLLDLGVPVNARFALGDGYWGVARESTALHVAAWRAAPHVVKLLIEHGADVHVVDAAGRTALDLAVKACVDSHWTERRSPDSVRLLLAAGARADAVAFPSGYADVDRLLEAARSRPT